MGKFFKSIFKGLAHLVALFFKIIYNILKWLKIRVLTLYLIVCGIVQLIFKVFNGEGIAWFWTGFVLCCMVTVVAWIVGFTTHRRVKERKRAEKAEAEEEGEKPAEQSEAASAPQPQVQPQAKPAPTPAPEILPQKQECPRYFAVEGREDYYFAEYSDRYELFKREKNGDFHVRTDYKRE